MSQNALRPGRPPTSVPIRPACSYASCQRRWIAATLRVRQDERQRRCASTDCVRQVLPSQHKMRISRFVTVAIFHSNNRVMAQVVCSLLKVCSTMHVAVFMARLFQWLSCGRKTTPNDVKNDPQWSFCSVSLSTMLSTESWRPRWSVDTDDRTEPN
jgi:hypothetical protein